MKIYIYIDCLDEELFEESESQLAQKIGEWVETRKSNLLFVNTKGNELPTGLTLRSGHDFGVIIDTRKPATLGKVLDFLYDCSKTYKLDFVIGLFDKDAQTPEDVCYFGSEAGKPDIDEVACYLGMNN